MKKLKYDIKKERYESRGKKIVSASNVDEELGESDEVRQQHR